MPGSGCWCLCLINTFICDQKLFYSAYVYSRVRKFVWRFRSFFFPEYLNRHVIHRDLDWRILVRSDSQRRSSRLLRNFKYEKNNVLTNKLDKAGWIKAAWKADCSFCVAWTQDSSGLFEALSFFRFGKRIVFRYYVCVCVYVYVYVIYQTRNTVFDRISKHREESWKYDAQRSIFDQLRGVWKCGQTLSWVFDIFSQSKLKP